MNLSFALLACVGLTFILKYGSIFNAPRQLLCKFSVLDNLLKCSLCLGFWSGLTIAFCSYFIKWDPLLFFLPLASSALCWAADSSLRVIQTVELSLDKYLDKK